MYRCHFTPPAAAAYGLPHTPESSVLAQPPSPRGFGAPVEPMLAARAADFDFLHGQWLVENRRSADLPGIAGGPLAFDSIHTCRPLASGGHLEEPTDEDAAAGATLRLFDSRHRLWTVYRISPVEGVLKGPLRGAFRDGIGIFVGEEIRWERRVLVRETWSLLEEKPHWELAVSSDDGAAWKTQWIRDFIRVDWP